MWACFTSRQADVMRPGAGDPCVNAGRIPGQRGGVKSGQLAERRSCAVRVVLGHVAHARLWSFAESQAKKMGEMMGVEQTHLDKYYINQLYDAL